MILKFEAVQLGNINQSLFQFREADFQPSLAEVLESVPNGLPLLVTTIASEDLGLRCHYSKGTRNICRLDKEV